MAVDWYYQETTGETRGPFDANQLLRMVVTGTITPDILIRKREDGDWIAAEQIQGQMTDFVRLGVIGDWERPYRTMDFVNEAGEVRALAEMVRHGYVFKGLKPVNWCFDCGSALAEAEVEYQDKKSEAIDVAFPVEDAPPEVVDAMQRQYSLDNPWSFYWDYLGNATGVSWVLGDRSGPVFDLGPSLRHENWTVNEILAAQLPVSIVLGLTAIILACFIGITAGVLGAIRPGSWIDMTTLLVALIGISLPAFVTGTVLLVVLAVNLGFFPIGGWGSLSHIALPALALSLPFAAYIARLVRSGMLEELQSDYVRTARAKGLPERVGRSSPFPTTLLFNGSLSPSRNSISA